MWHLERSSARLESPSVSALVDLPHPDKGIDAWFVKGAPLPGLRILQVTCPLATNPATRISESFVRGDDLVVGYQECADQIRCQLNWRALAVRDADVVAGVELLVSIQTQLLDSRPRILVTSSFPPGTTLADPPNPSNPALQVFRLAGIELSYVQAVYPADFAASQFLPSPMLQYQTALRVERMEKGVIRCCRVRGWWVARSSDLRLANQLAAEFLADPLPLTA